MRKSGTATSIPYLDRKRRGTNPRRRGFSSVDSVILLVGFGLAHDFLRREIDAAGREGVADEEVVGLGGVVVLAVLEVWIFDDRERQFHRLRDDVALEGVERSLDGDRHLRRAGA